MALTHDEREQFLAEPHIAALAVDAGEGRGPLTVPIWYQYTAGGDVWIMTGDDSRKARLIAAAGRFTLMVERLEPTIRYVSVEGPVIGTDPPTRELLEELSARYLPAEKVQDYVDFSLQNHGGQVLIRMRPQRWISADLGQV